MTQSPWPGAEHGALEPGSSALNVRPPHLTLTGYDHRFDSLYSFWENSVDINYFPSGLSLIDAGLSQEIILPSIT